jgi:hypothetical protein
MAKTIRSKVLQTLRIIFLPHGVKAKHGTVSRLNYIWREPTPPEDVGPKLDIVIEGVQVFAVESAPTGVVRFCAPGHPWNPTEQNILACDLATYVSLAASRDSQRLVSFMVHDALRALRVKAQADARREQRANKRAAQASHGS